MVTTTNFETQAAQHRDDVAVDAFAAAMKAKMAAARDKGRGGWDDPGQCTVESLQQMLLEHLHKGDPVDIANFTMMLHHRHAPAVAQLAARELNDETVEDKSKEIAGICDYPREHMPEKDRKTMRDNVRALLAAKGGA